VPAPPSPGGYAPSPGSTSTPSRKNSSSIPPAAHVRRPRLDYESHATALDRNELGAILVAAGLGSPAEHALISPLALNGLRVSEAAGADIEELGLERGIARWSSPARAARSSPSRLPAHRAGDRSGGGCAHGRSALRHRGRAAAVPARCRPDRPPGHPSRRDRQARQPPHAGRISDALYRRLRADARRTATASAKAAGPGGQAGNDTDASAAGSHPEHQLFGKATPGPSPTLRPAPRTQPNKPSSRPSTKKARTP
jgi:hypothetical protein